MVCCIAPCWRAHSLTNMTETKCSLGVFGHEDYVADEFIAVKSVRKHLGIKHLQCTFKRQIIMVWMVLTGVCEACIQTQETFYWLLMVKVNHHFF